MNTALYTPQTAADFFRELQAAAGRMPDYAAVYDAMARTFKHCLEEQTADVKAILGGTFAKTDYLLKVSKAAKPLARQINDTRVRIDRKKRLSADEMRQYCRHDLRHIATFISHICQTPVPASLAQLFPAEEYTPQDQPVRGLVVGDSLRVIVDDIDDHYIYVRAEADAEGKLLRVDYTAPNRAYPYDWTYLKAIVQEGSQLNLIRPRTDGSVLLPELIIFEPDYLVDVSSVARCFTNYAESSVVDTLNKLSPSQQTEAIILGNLAGQLLDETLHEQGAPRPYGDSARDFYRSNAISLLTANVSPQLHQDAQAQQRNIRRAMHEVLPATVPGFDLKEGVVEPSFICEMLGLQGRMDYLQQDFRVLIEQKSGKGDYPYDGFVIPRQREEHYVQMLLYMLIVRYNYREQYTRNGESLFAYLLYSKYQNSLLNLGFAPGLVFRALKVRNGMAARGLRLMQPDAYRFLERTSPDSLNMKKTTGTLWKNYQRVQLAELLLPVQQATPLERAYYERFLTFITTEHVLSKMGNKTKEGSGFAAIWHNTLEEKRLAGNIYDGLTLQSPDASAQGPIEMVRLAFSETPAGDMSNFRVGDIVILYPYRKGAEPDARRTPVLRCTIAELQEKTVTLRLRAPQTDNRVFRHEAGRSWAIEHDFMESSYNGLYKGMHAFLSATQRRRDLILLQREPETDTARMLRGNYGAFSEMALRVKQARDFFLIIGPPGTGKTSYGMLNTVREELLEPNGSVLLLSYTNRAVDEICSKLMEEGIDFLRIGSALSCAEEYRDKLLSERATRVKNVDELREMLCTRRVVVATTTSMTSNIALLQLRRFSLAVIDEASQILEPHLAAILSAQTDGKSSVRKFVMIGDHKQLPAVVQQTTDQSYVKEPCLRHIGLTDCRASLFERLLRRYAGREDVTYMLTKQGRMHPDIAEFPNRAFYGGKLQIVPLSHQKEILSLASKGRNGIEDLLQTRRMAFLAVKPYAETPSEKVNAAEAEVIAATVLKIYELERDAFDVNETVGVIVPYRNQIAAVRSVIDRSGITALHDITIDTVERFQGSQRRYIVYGFTVQRYYQLRFLTNNVFLDEEGNFVDRKLNVAMTRAKEHLIMTGNPDLLSQIRTFKDLINFTKHREGFFAVDVEAYKKGRFAVPPRTARSFSDMDEA